MRSGLQKIHTRSHDVILPLLWLLLSCCTDHAHVTNMLDVLQLVLKLTELGKPALCELAKMRVDNS